MLKFLWFLLHIIFHRVSMFCFIFSIEIYAYFHIDFRLLFTLLSYRLQYLPANVPLFRRGISEPSRITERVQGSTKV